MPAPRHMSRDFSEAVIQVQHPPPLDRTRGSCSFSWPIFFSRVNRWQAGKQQTSPSPNPSRCGSSMVKSGISTSTEEQGGRICLSNNAANADNRITPRWDPNPLSPLTPGLGLST